MALALACRIKVTSPAQSIAGRQGPFPIQLHVFWNCPDLQPTQSTFR